MKSLMLMIGFLIFGAAAFAQGSSEVRVALETNHGSIVLELDGKHAPITTASFLEEVDAGTYDGLIFHRVIPNFMIQGGGFKPGMEKVPTDKALQNEANNGLKNLRGTVAMARMPDPHSASIQFFINVVDNPALDHTAKTDQGWGYAVFARVVEGMEVAEAIAKVDRGRSGVYGDVPNVPVIIERAKRVAAEEPAADQQ